MSSGPIKLNVALIDFLSLDLSFIMNFTVFQPPMEPLSGYVLVFTGNMKMERDEAKRKALFLGARVTTAISSKTTHLVTGDEPGVSKIKKAKELELKIINEEEFLEILERYKSKMKVEILTNEAADVKPHENILENRVELQQPWTEKYRPKKKNELVGNISVFDQLEQFILGKSEKKGALLSGSPGVGKTSAALLLCKLNGVMAIEFNASDCRSKKNIKENISELISSNTINNGKRVLIMDEVDGMTSDRGGIPELVNLIKKSTIPIICICNDKSHLKMRTLANHCLDLHCRKLDSRMIMPRLKEILRNENKTLNDGILQEIISNSNGDMRYILNTVQSIVCKDKISMDSISKNLVQKNQLKGTFEIAAEMFQRKSIDEKTQLYFEDYSLMPLFVQENYIKFNFLSLKDLLISSESISYSDILDARIHGTEQEWSLMPYHAFYSCIYPTKSKVLQKRIDFPLFLGQNSKMNKNLRLLSEITSHLKTKITRKDFRKYGADLLYQIFIKKLSEGNISEVISILIETELMKEDLINIGDILGKDQMKGIPTKIKTAFTKEYKKLFRVLPYSVGEINVEKEEGSNDSD